MKILPSYFSSITSTFSVNIYYEYADIHNIYNKNIRKDKIEKWKKKLNYY